MEHNSRLIHSMAQTTYQMLKLYVTIPKNVTTAIAGIFAAIVKQIMESNQTEAVLNVLRCGSS